MVSCKFSTLIRRTRSIVPRRMGIINPAMKKTYRKFAALEFHLARAYAAIDPTNKISVRDTIVTIKVFRKYRSKRPVFHAAMYPSNVKFLGKPNGSLKISFCGLNELMSSVQIGNRTITDQTVRRTYVR